MTNNLLFDFTVDKTTNSVFVVKEFDASLPLVWDAFTQQDLLDQWWAPHPFIAKTIFMDFKVGGKRFYAMVNPDGTKIGWQVFNYTSITPTSNFKCDSTFTDKHETPIPPTTYWDHNFIEHNGITNVNISIRFDSLDGLEKMIDMGFKEGFTVTLNELSTILKNRK